jgi:hypothetical protein
MTPHPATAAAELAISVAPPPVIASTNWSGYFVEGGSSGPFTGVTGTFTVPSLVAPVQAGTWVFEWVGIDGATNTSLIQAGVAEYGCGSQECLSPWWEVLPAAATDIPMVVAANDQVTVTIAQVSGTGWGITLSDDTTGHTFSQAVTYTGPRASAEWIVEDPTNAQTGTLSPFADYTVTTFSGLGISGGPQETLTEVVMLQGATQLSTPSPWTASGFNVAYGDVAPPPP